MAWRQAQQLQQWQGWRRRVWLGSMVGLVILAMPAWQMLAYHRMHQQLVLQQYRAGQLLEERQLHLQQALQPWLQRQREMHRQAGHQVIGASLLAFLDSLPTDALVQRWSMVDGVVAVDLILSSNWSDWWQQVQAMPWWSKAELLQLTHSGSELGRHLQVRLVLLQTDVAARHG